MTFSSSQQIVLASGNQGKIKEIQAILAVIRLFRSRRLMLQKPRKPALHL